MPQQYRVLYSFLAQGAEELSVTENDTVVGLGEPTDGWVLACRADQRTMKGFVPESYLEPIAPEPDLFPASAFPAAQPFAGPPPLAQSSASGPAFGFGFSAPAPAFGTPAGFGFPAQQAFTGGMVSSAPAPMPASSFGTGFGFGAPVVIEYPELAPVQPNPAYSEVERAYAKAVEPFRSALSEVNGKMTSAMESINSCKEKNFLLSSRVQRLVDEVQMNRRLWNNNWMSMRQVLAAVNPQPAPPGWKPTALQAPQPTQVALDNPIPVGAGTPPFSSGPPPLSSGPPPLSSGPPPHSWGPPPLSSGTPPLSSGPPPLSSGPPPLSSPISPMSPLNADAAEEGVDPELAAAAMSALKTIEDKIGDIRSKYEATALSPLNTPGKDVKDIQEARKIFDELLLQQMMKVDGVDSCGSTAVRKKRKAMLAEVEELHRQLDVLAHEDQQQQKQAQSKSDALFAGLPLPIPMHS
eukprot:RCo045978